MNKLLKKAVKTDLIDSVEEMVYDHLQAYDTLRAKEVQYITSYHECTECGEVPTDGGFASLEGKPMICLSCIVYELEEVYMESCIR